MEKHIKGNIIISEFLGRKFYAYKDNSSYNTEFNSYSECMKFIEANRLEGYKPELGWQLSTGDYHNNWNSLIEAVEKIENLSNLNNGFGFIVEIGCWTCSIKDLFSGESISHTSPSSTTIKRKIDAVYASVVDFIKWLKVNHPNT